MRFTLRSLVLAPVVLVAVAFTANSAMAETQVNVPFNFSVNGKSLPAGQYRVQSDKTGDSVTLEGASQTFTFLLHPGSPAPNDKRVVLKFDQLGMDHVLRSVQYNDEVTSRLDKHVKETDSASVRDVQGQ